MSLNLDNNQLYKIAFENAHDIILILDCDIIVYANDSAAKLFGLDCAKKLIGMSVIDLSPTLQANNVPSRERAMKKVQNCIDFGQATFTWLHKNLVTNNILCCSVSLTRVIIDDKPYIFSIIRDETMNESLKIELKLSEHRYRSALDAANEGLWEFDLKTGDFSFLSPKWYTMLGFLPYEFPPTINSWLSLLHPDDMDDAYSYFKNINNRFELVFRLRMKNDDYMWILCQGTAIEYDNFNNPLKMMGTHTNINLLKEFEEERIQFNRKLLDLNTQISQKYLQVKNTLSEIVSSLASTIQFSDPYTYQHQIRVAKLTKLICRQLKLPENEIDGIVTAAKLHDVGKLGIPKEILVKPAKLSFYEFQLVKEHALFGYEIIKDISFCQPIKTYIKQHHERLDGSGYPDGLRAPDILFGSQILAVADTVEAIATHRPYRASLGLSYAKHIIEDGSGQLFDEDIVQACQVVLNGIENIELI